MRYFQFSMALSLVFTLACDPGSAPLDAGQSEDAGAAQDAGIIEDAGPACAHGTTDSDQDPNTACQPCTVCDPNEISFGICTPASDPVCAPCASNPGNPAPQVPAAPPVDGCSQGDAQCEETIDVLVVYTPAMLAMVDGDLAGLEARVHYWLNLANEGLDESLLPPNMRYRLAAIAPFPYVERDHLGSDLIWFKNNPYFHEFRRSYGADTAAIFGGTSGFGALAYSSLGIGPTLDNRGIVIIDGHYHTDDWERCGETLHTPAHEMGHLLGMYHRGSMMRGDFEGRPNTSNFGYHTLEPNYRRNEAYGIDLDQHGQRRMAAQRGEPSYHECP